MPTVCVLFLRVDRGETALPDSYNATDKERTVYIAATTVLSETAVTVINSNRQSSSNMLIRAERFSTKGWLVHQADRPV